jgi:hypothetical protein
MMVPHLVMQTMVPRGGARLYRFGLTRRVALVLLRSAHRAHRQFETPLNVECCSECWDEEGESANHHQARSKAKHDFHDGRPATKDHVQSLLPQLKDIGGLI